MTPHSFLRRDFKIERDSHADSFSVDQLSGTAPLPGWVGLLLTLLLLCFVLLVTLGLPFAQISHVVDRAASVAAGQSESGRESSDERRAR